MCEADIDWIGSGWEQSRTYGDLLDLLTSYKETKLLTESAGIGLKFANSINIKFDNNFKEGKLAVLKFK